VLCNIEYMRPCFLALNCWSCALELCSICVGGCTQVYIALPVALYLLERAWRLYKRYLDKVGECSTRTACLLATSLPAHVLVFASPTNVYLSFSS
jgi:hypothetical protein